MSKENPGECHCCGFITQALTFYPDMPTHLGGGGQTIQGDFWFCDLCASTPASTYYRYAGMQPSNMEVMKTICHIGNVLLAAMRATDHPAEATPPAQETTR